jgi:exodeoxyribonuclease-1
MEHWEQHRASRLYEGAGGARTIDDFFARIDELQQQADERAEQILGELYEYAELVAPPQ